MLEVHHLGEPREWVLDRARIERVPRPHTFEAAIGDEVDVGAGNHLQAEADGTLIGQAVADEVLLQLTIGLGFMVWR